jgi:arylsulfatase A-like enzyme
MSANGYDRSTTPFLDSLVADSYVFDDAYTPIPRTTQALASLLTGTYPHTNRVRTLADTLSPEVQTLTEVLRAEGYQTRAIVSNHILSPRRGLNRGFDVYGSTDHAIEAGVLTNYAVELIEELDHERPAFLWFHYIDPHIPYAPPKRLVESFDPGYRGLHTESFKLKYSAEEIAAGEETGKPTPKRGQLVHRNQYSESVSAHIRRLYAGEIRDFDDALHQLFAAIRSAYGDRVLTVFTADHGESLGEHDFYWDHGDYVYNASVRVPLAVALPADHPLSGGGRCAGPASLIDVTPTVLDLLGVEPVGTMRTQLEGRSLVPCMRGDSQAPRPVFIESGTAFYPRLVRRRVRYDVAGRFRAVVHNGWKLIWTPFGPPGLEWELYHLTSDPQETVDLYREEHPQSEMLKEMLRGWMVGQDVAARPNPFSDEDTAALRSLGYIE